MIGGVLARGIEAGDPLDVDLVADGALGSDPAAALERAEAVEMVRRALGTLGRDEIRCLVGMVRGEENWKTASAIGVGWEGLVAVREEAMAKMRRALEAQGWDG